MFVSYIGFNSTCVVLPCLNMQGLVEDVMQVYQDDMTMYGGDYEYGGGSVPGAWSKLAVGQIRGASEYPQQNHNERL